MLFLLYWLCYAAAFGTATCYIAYKTALVHRILAAGLRRGLRGTIHDITNDSEQCTIVRTDSGTYVGSALCRHTLHVLYAVLAAEDFAACTFSCFVILRSKARACNSFKGCAGDN